MYIDFVSSLPSSGVFVSYIRENGDITFGIFKESNLLSTSPTFSDGPNPKINHNILKEFNIKTTNYNPNDPTDRYGEQHKNKFYLKYAHTLEDIKFVEDNQQKDNAIFNINLNTIFNSIAINTYQWNTTPTSYTVGPKLSIMCNDNNNELWGRISLDVNKQYLPIGSGYLYAIQNYDYHNFNTADIFIHDNHKISMGDNSSSTIAVTEDVLTKTIQFSINLTNKIDVLNSAGIATINSEFLEINTYVNIMTKKDPVYKFSNSSYSVTFPWDDNYYKIITGSSIADTWNLVGYFQNSVVSKYLGLPLDYISVYTDTTFSHPTLTGCFYYLDSDIMISGYYNDSSISVYTPVSTKLAKMHLYYSDDNGEQFIDSKNLTSINLITSHKNLRGKNCHIKTYYNTIADEFYNLSSSVVPIYENYFDIEDVTLTMSGTRNDPSLGDIEYTSNTLSETNGIVTENRINRTFMSIGEVKCILNLTVKGNTIDYDNITRVLNPYPRDIWFIAIPKSGLSNETLKNIFLKISDDVILINRDTPYEKTKYPKINSSIAKSMSELCTGTANTLTAEGVIWNKLTPGNFEIPEDGTFSEDTYTIDIILPQGSWAPFLVISDMGVSGHANYTGYCLSNLNNYEAPNKSSFNY